MTRNRPASAPPGRQVEHGSNRPAPEPSAFTSGAGVFRTFAPHSKYLATDPLGYSKRLQPQDSFALGPLCNKGSGSCFRALDVSKYNEKRYKWNRLDTFQTPLGHLGGDSDSASLATSPSKHQGHSSHGFQGKLLQALEADLFEEFHACLGSFASEVVEGLSEQLHAFRHDLAESLDLFRADTLGAKCVSTAGGSAASSHEAHNDRGVKSVGDADMCKVVEEVRAGTLAVLDSIKQNRLEMTDRSATEASSLLGAIQDATATLSEQISALRAQSAKYEKLCEEQIPAPTAQSSTPEVHLSKVLEAFDAHASVTRTAFVDISKAVLGEVRKGWVEVGAVWGYPPDEKVPGAGAQDVDLSEVLRAFEVHAKSSVAALEDIRTCVLDNAHNATHEVQAPPPGSAAITTLAGVDGLAGASEDRILSKVNGDHKVAMIELQKITAVLDGLMDISSSNFDLSPVLEAIKRLDCMPSDVNFDSVFRAITEAGTSIASAQTHLSQAGKLPTCDDILDLRQVILANLKDLAVTCVQTREKMDSLEERLISRMSSNHKVAMFELQKTNTASTTEATPLDA